MLHDAGRFSHNGNIYASVAREPAAPASRARKPQACHDCVCIESSADISTPFHTIYAP